MGIKSKEFNKENKGCGKVIVIGKSVENRNIVVKCNKLDLCLSCSSLRDSQNHSSQKEDMSAVSTEDKDPDSPKLVDVSRTDEGIDSGSDIPRDKYILQADAMKLFDKKFDKFIRLLKAKEIIHKYGSTDIVKTGQINIEEIDKLAGEFK